jgi:hypothetical protein
MSYNDMTSAAWDHRSDAEARRVAEQIVDDGRLQLAAMPWNPYAGGGT